MSVPSSTVILLDTELMAGGSRIEEEINFIKHGPCYKAMTLYIQSHTLKGGATIHEIISSTTSISHF